MEYHRKKEIRDGYQLKQKQQILALHITRLDRMKTERLVENQPSTCKTTSLVNLSHCFRSLQLLIRI